MAHTIKNKVGSDLSGSTNTAGRTFTISDSDYIANTLTVALNGMALHEGAGNDWTISGLVITFVGVVNDADVIRLIYWQTSEGGGTSTATDYCASTDVQAELQGSTAFTTSTIPTLQQVINFINMAEDEIDRRTRNSWRSVTTTNEFYNIERNAKYHWGGGLRIPLNHTNIKSFDTSEGDKLEIWQGNSYVDWIATKTEGRANDFWMDYKEGTLFIRLRFPAAYVKPIRLTYRHGESSVPNDIKNACVMLASMKILRNEDFSFTLNESGDTRNLNYEQRILQMKDDVDKIVSHRQQVFII